MMKRKMLSILIAVLMISWSTFAFAEEENTSPEQAPIEAQITSTSTTATQSYTTISSDQNISAQNSDTTESLTDNDNLNATVSNVTVTNDQTTSTSTTQNNTIGATIDTGHNTVEDNSLISNYETGNIGGQITAARVNNTDLNDNSQIEIKTAISDNEINADDFNNMDSVFSIEGESNQSNNFFILNESDNIDLELNTGENNFNRNSVIGDVQTGRINFATNAINLTNLNNPDLLLNLKVYTILDNFNGDIVLDETALNEKPDVTIMATENSSSTNTTNTTNTNNETNYAITTGDNSFARNSVLNSVESGAGSAGYFEDILGGTFAKTNFYIINVLEGWEGENQLSGYDNVVVNVIPCSTTTAIIDVQETEASIQENTINQDRTINVSANTGKNSFKENTYINSLKTGDVKLMQNVVSLQNDLKSLGSNLNIYVINILGRWKGGLLKTKIADKQNSDPVILSSDEDVATVAQNTSSPLSSQSSISMSTTDAHQDKRKLSARSDEVSVINATDSLNSIDASSNGIVAGDSSTTNTPNWLYFLLLIPLAGGTTLAFYGRKA